MTELLRVKEKADDLLRVAGAFSSTRIADITKNDGRLTLACLDYLVETGKLREVTPADTVRQRIFAEEA